jgi:hypothetical protein
LPYLPLVAWQAEQWLRPVGEATLFRDQGFPTMLDATLEGWGGNFIGEPWATLILVGLALLAFGGLAWTWLTGSIVKVEAGVGARDSRTNNWREPVALLTWMLVPLLGIWLISTRQPIFTNRYLVWAAPAFYLLAAAGAVALARRGLIGRLVAGGVLLLVLLGDGRALLYQADQSIKPDFRAAAAYLDGRYQSGDVVIFHLSYMQHNFDFYFPDDYAGWGAPVPGNGLSETDLDFHMRTNTSGYRMVWLVLSEPEMWDPQGLIKAWLDTHAINPPEEQVFSHVSVLRYQLDQGVPAKDEEAPTKGEFGTPNPESPIPNNG